MGALRCEIESYHFLVKLNTALCVIVWQKEHQIQC